MALNIIVPMAGEGQRFKDLGYKPHKPFIMLGNKPIIWYALSSLKIPNSQLYVIAQKEHVEQNKEIFLKLKSEFNFKEILLSEKTEGSVCTLLKAKDVINNSDHLLIANSDQYIDLNLKSFIEDAIAKNLDGSILTFEDQNTKWSYAKLDSSGLVEKTEEKKIISPYATVGIYFFKKGSDFINASEQMISENFRVNNEFYTCPTYNYLIDKNKRIGIFNIEKNKMWGLGTPEDVAYFQQEKLPSLNTPL